MTCLHQIPPLNKTIFQQTLQITFHFWTSEWKTSNRFQTTDTKLFFSSVLHLLCCFLFCVHKVKRPTDCHSNWVETTLHLPSHFNVVRVWARLSFIILLRFSPEKCTTHQIIKPETNVHQITRLYCRYNNKKEDVKKCRATISAETNTF